jgi:sulfatase maturation enzyme AslB (radical SAM superfamily)
MSKDTFCILPWMHLATNASGNYRVCCNSTPGKNFITDPEGRPYKIYQSDPKEIWNTEVYKKLRLELLNGRKAEMCQRCWREEATGIKSARQGYNESYERFINEAKATTTESGEAPLKGVYVDLRLGNLCNLKCRMCNPWASNQWTEEWSNLTSYDGSNIDDTERTRLAKMDWPQNPKLWENLMSIIDTVEEIYLTGGEPTLAIEQYKLFDKCIAMNKAKDIILKYNTNMTNIPPKMVEYWKHFKKIKINASIDAYGDLNRYIRYPTNWKLVQKNIENFHRMEREGNYRVQVHTTVQMYNALNITELFDYLKDYNYFPYLNILNHPDYLNIRTLTPELKKEAFQRINAWTMNNQAWIDNNEHDISKLEGVIDYMYAEDWTKHQKRFSEYTKELDKSRNQSILDTVPEYAPFV